MRDLSEYQKLLSDQELNPYIDIEITDKVLLHLVEEVGELIRAYRKLAVSIDKNFNITVNDSGLKAELGDVMILLLFTSESLGLDLETCLINKINENIDKGKFYGNKL